MMVCVCRMGDFVVKCDVPFGGYAGGLKQFAADHLRGMKQGFSQLATTYGVLVGTRIHIKEFANHRNAFTYKLAELAVSGGGSNIAVFFIDYHSSNRWFPRGIIGNYNDCVKYFCEEHMRRPDHYSV